MIQHILCAANHPDIHHYDLNFTRNIQFTLLRNKAFFIDVYLWMEHTEIHAHNFSGAFQVMEGKFNQTRYTFDAGKGARDWNLGKLSLEARESLALGQAYAIHSGERFIHQVYHFDNPSISICIRTNNTTRPYYSYFYPGLRLKETGFKRPDILRIKALHQLSEINGKLTKKNCADLISTLPLSPLMNDYLLSLPTFNLGQEQKSLVEKTIEARVIKECDFDLKDIRRKNLVHMTKLEMSPL